MIGLLRRVLADERGEIEDAPAVIFLVGGALFTIAAALFIAGQYANAQTQVQAAAFAAARDASLSSPLDGKATVQARAVAAARDALATGIDCGPLTVTVDLAARIAAVGQPGTVKATVTCNLHYATIRFPGLPTTATITETAVSPTDPYRDQP